MVGRGRPLQRKMLAKWPNQRRGFSVEAKKCYRFYHNRRLSTFNITTQNSIPLEKGRWAELEYNDVHNLVHTSHYAKTSHKDGTCINIHYDCDFNGGVHCSGLTVAVSSRSSSLLWRYRIKMATVNHKMNKQNGTDTNWYKKLIMIILSIYLFMLIHRYSLNPKQSHL